MRDALWRPTAVSYHRSTTQRFLSTPQMYSIAVILLQSFVSAATQEQQWSCSYSLVGEIVCRKRLRISEEASSNQEPSQIAQPRSIKLPEEPHQRSTQATSNRPETIRSAKFSDCTEKCRNSFEGQYSPSAGNTAEQAPSFGTSSQRTNSFFRQSSKQVIKGRAVAQRIPVLLPEDHSRSPAQTQHLASSVQEGRLNHSKIRLLEPQQSGNTVSNPFPCIQQLVKLLRPYLLGLLNRGNAKEAVTLSQTMFQGNQQNPRLPENQQGTARPLLRAPRVMEGNLIQSEQWVRNETREQGMKAGLEGQYQQPHKPTPASTEHHQQAVAEMLVNGLLNYIQKQGTGLEMGAQNNTPHTLNQQKMSNGGQDRIPNKQGAQQEVNLLTKWGTNLQSSNRNRADNSREGWSDSSSQSVEKRVQYQSLQNTSSARREGGYSKKSLPGIPRPSQTVPKPKEAIQTQGVLFTLSPPQAVNQRTRNASSFQLKRQQGQDRELLAAQKNPANSASQQASRSFDGTENKEAYLVHQKNVFSQQSGERADKTNLFQAGPQNNKQRQPEDNRRLAFPVRMPEESHKETWGGFIPSSHWEHMYKHRQPNAEHKQSAEGNPSTAEAGESKQTAPQNSIASLQGAWPQKVVRNSGTSVKIFDKIQPILSQNLSGSSGNRPATLQGTQKLAVGQPPAIRQESPLAAQGTSIPTQPRRLAHQLNIKSPFSIGRHSPWSSARNHSLQTIQQERVLVQRPVAVKQTAFQGGKSVPWSDPGQPIIGMKSLPLAQEDRQQWPPLNTQGKVLTNKPPQQNFQPKSLQGVNVAAQQNDLQPKLNTAVNESRSKVTQRNSTPLALNTKWQSSLMRPRVKFQGNSKTLQGSQNKPAASQRTPNGQQPAGREKENLVPNPPQEQRIKQNAPPITKGTDEMAPVFNHGAGSVKNKLTVQATQRNPATRMKSSHAVHPALQHKENLAPKQPQQKRAASNSPPMAKATEQQMPLLKREGDHVKNLVPQPVNQAKQTPGLKAPRVIHPILQRQNSSVRRQPPRPAIKRDSAPLKPLTQSFMPAVERQRNFVTNALPIRGIKQKAAQNLKGKNVLQPLSERRGSPLEKLQQLIYKQNSASLPQLSPQRTLASNRQSSSLPNKTPPKAIPPNAAEYVTPTELFQPPLQRNARQPQQTIQPNSKPWAQPRMQRPQGPEPEETSVTNQTTQQDDLPDSNAVGQQLLYPVLNISDPTFAKQDNPPDT